MAKTEEEAQAIGWKAGQRSMRARKGALTWNQADAVAAIVAYRKAAGKPGADPDSARAALETQDA